MLAPRTRAPRAIGARAAALAAVTRPGHPTVPRSRLDPAWRRCGALCARAAGGCAARGKDNHATQRAGRRVVYRPQLQLIGDGGLFAFELPSCEP